MEFDVEGKVSKFDVNDVIEINGKKYGIDLGAAFNLNYFIRWMRSPGYIPERDLQINGVSLRRFGSPSLGGECDVFNYGEVFLSPSLIQNNIKQVLNQQDQV